MLQIKLKGSFIQNIYVNIVLKRKPYMIRIGRLDIFSAQTLYRVMASASVSARLLERRAGKRRPFKRLNDYDKRM